MLESPHKWIYCAADFAKVQNYLQDWVMLAGQFWASSFPSPLWNMINDMMNAIVIVVVIVSSPSLSPSALASVHWKPEKGRGRMPCREHWHQHIILSMAILIMLLVIVVVVIMTNQHWWWWSIIQNTNYVDGPSITDALMHWWWWRTTTDGGDWIGTNDLDCECLRWNLWKLKVSVIRRDPLYERQFSSISNK